MDPIFLDLLKNRKLQPEQKFASFSIVDMTTIEFKKTKKKCNLKIYMASLLEYGDVTYNYLKSGVNHYVKLVRHSGLK